MSKITLLRNEAGAITGAAIDGVAIDGFVSVTQSLAKGCLTTTLTMNFDCVEVASAIAPPVPAPALEATFAEGTITGTTKAVIVDQAGAGNKFAYKVGTTEFDTPNVDDVVADATAYASGEDITGVDADTNKYLALYELTAENKVVKFSGYTLESTEITS